VPPDAAGTLTPSRAETRPLHLLHPRRAAVGARIVRGFAAAVRMQHRGAGVAHDVGIRLGKNIDVVAGGGESVTEIAVNAPYPARRRRGAWPQFCIYED
jgi:hypothetical protein